MQIIRLNKEVEWPLVCFDAVEKVGEIENPLKVETVFRADSACLTFSDVIIPSNTL